MVLWIGVVVGTGGVVCEHGLECFSTLQASVQYAEKHQPSPSVSLYIKLSEGRMTERKTQLKKNVKPAHLCSEYDAHV